MAYRGRSSDERLRAARAADRERDQLQRVLADLATELATEETRETEHEQLLRRKLSGDEHELVAAAHQQIESSCKELRAQIARITARHDSLAAPAGDLADARAERVASIAHTPNGRAALELVVHLGELDSMTQLLAEAIRTGLLLKTSIFEHLLADGVTPYAMREAHNSDTTHGFEMKRWIDSVRGALGYIRADLSMFRHQLAALGIHFDPVLPAVPAWNPLWLVVEPSMEVVANLWGPISGLSTDVATQVGVLRKRAADVSAEITSVEDECDRLLLV